MINEPFYILTVFVGIIALTLMLVRRYEIARKISPVILILFFTALLSNFGIVPHEHRLYDQLSRYTVPFAVCLILLGVRLADIRKTGLPVFKAFAVASLGSFVGCLVGGAALAVPLDKALAGDGWKLAGPYIGTYIGGSLNFVSMWSALEIDNPDLFAAANAVDNLALVPIFMFWMLCPYVLQKWYPQTVQQTPAEVRRDEPPTAMKLEDIITLVLIGFGVIVLADAIKAGVQRVCGMNIPSILIVTTLSLLSAQCRCITRLQGAKELSSAAFYLFFAVIGAMMDIPKAIGLAPLLFVYVAIIIAVQIVFVLLAGWAFKMDLRLLAVASLAAKAGPSTVAAYTNAKNWDDLTLPGIAAALAGYAIGNYAGWAGAYLLKSVVGRDNRVHRPPLGRIFLLSHSLVRSSLT